jgi:hypothetical protein
LRREEGREEERREHRAFVGTHSMPYMVFGRKSGVTATI